MTMCFSVDVSAGVSARERKAVFSGHRGPLYYGLEVVAGCLVRNLP